MIFFLLTALFPSCCSKSPAEYVNPLIGHRSQLLVPCYPTIHLPNSFVRLIPERKDYDADEIAGTPSFLTSHRGLYAFRILPTQRRSQPYPEAINYSYDEEIVRPYYYNVFLDEEEVDIRVTPSHDSAFYEYTFVGSNPKAIVVSFRKGQLLTDSEGFGICDSTNMNTYMFGEFSPQPAQVTTQGKSYVFHFPPTVNKVSLRCGYSLLSLIQAKVNLRSQINTWDFDQVCEAAKQTWNNALGKIQVSGPTEADHAVFYTSMYRTYERMVNISESGRYFSGYDNKTHEDEGISFYVDDWIWDTFRATHPLRLLIEREKEAMMLRSYLRMAEQSADGFLPTFPEVSGDSHRMNGKHTIATLADALAKGLKGFNASAVYAVSRKTQLECSLLPWTRQPIFELDILFQKQGYYQGIYENETEPYKQVHGFEKRQCVAVTLAACYDDWCLAQLAAMAGLSEDVTFWIRRSSNFHLLLHDSTLFFHPRDKTGAFLSPFDYKTSGGPGGRMYYDENTGWTYRWDVQHAPSLLLSLMHGDVVASANLDQAFHESFGMPRAEFYVQWADQTGNVGQFTMANEPSMHIPYYYTQMLQPWKTQKTVRFLLREWFRSDIMGVPGDEDGGGLCAFAVWSMMGFYPFTPGHNIYLIGTPQFNRTVLTIAETGMPTRTFTVTAQNLSPTNKYIQSATLNGRPFNSSYIDFSTVYNGGTIHFNMGPKPNKSWGVVRPPSPITKSPRFKPNIVY